MRRRGVIRDSADRPFSAVIDENSTIRLIDCSARHVDYTVYTDVPESFKALFRQRLLWWAGNYRHMVVNFDHNILQMPILTMYYVLGVWVGFYFHVWSSLSLMTIVHALPLILVVYLVITVVANTQVLSLWMLVFPLYSLAQSLIVAPLGAVNYVRLARQRRDLGRYRFGWGRRALA
jgi:cellulose synthase/poly-beta-1,6-N-acetylglucosamine synthase-like glycosyltransferase